MEGFFFIALAVVLIPVVALIKKFSIETGIPARYICFYSAVWGISYGVYHLAGWSNEKLIYVFLAAPALHLFGKLIIKVYAWSFEVLDEDRREI